MELLKNIKKSKDMDGNVAEKFPQVIIQLNFFSTNYRDEFQMFSNKAVVSILFVHGRQIAYFKFTITTWQPLQSEPTIPVSANMSKNHESGTIFLTENSNQKIIFQKIRQFTPHMTV